MSTSLASARTTRTPSVHFEHVWKRFRYGVVHDSLRDLIPAMTRRFMRRGPRSDEPGAGDFWALRDVSFRVAPGEALGIMGPNGSGKSTILKLLTRVLGPTRGRCEIIGRAGALIELQAGFHPDLTGRENVALQGAIMGMPTSEIARKFDQIVEFAGIAKFIDTPVKRYSSGMTARLGFAIAAHLDPEVLIVDEVLSVGDAAFQRKALARISDLVRGGIPVVIVTHQLEQVTALCTKALVLEAGQVVAEGAPGACVSAYLERSLHQATTGASPIVVERMELTPGATVVSGERITIGLNVVTRDPAEAPDHQVGLRLQAVTTAITLYEVALEDGGAVLPERSGWYWLAASCQMNVPPGAYYAEVVVRRRYDGHEVARGPGTYLDVVAGQPFEGQVQMNLACHVPYAEEFGAEHDYTPRANAAAWVSPTRG
ncbi:MAG: ABC transporter ATP-binding protein [Candidatus Eremiobacteraeota bacterium]|nr:ABC transporter ATP-binding protein [Candidatus Eremiobacteraeota bacterium]